MSISCLVFHLQLVEIDETKEQLTTGSLIFFPPSSIPPSFFIEQPTPRLKSQESSSFFLLLRNELRRRESAENVSGHTTTTTKMDFEMLFRLKVFQQTCVCLNLICFSDFVKKKFYVDFSCCNPQWWIIRWMRKWWEKNLSFPQTIEIEGFRSGRQRSWHLFYPISPTCSGFYSWQGGVFDLEFNSSLFIQRWLTLFF